MLRTHEAGSLRKEHIGQRATILRDVAAFARIGWAIDHAGILVFRDSGLGGNLDCQFARSGPAVAGRDYGTCARRSPVGCAS